MAVTIRGSKISTLDQRVLAKGSVVKAIYVNGTKVYPDKTKRTSEYLESLASETLYSVGGDVAYLNVTRGLDVHYCTYDHADKLDAAGNNLGRTLEQSFVVESCSKPVHAVRTFLNGEHDIYGTTVEVIAIGSPDPFDGYLINTYTRGHSPGGMAGTHGYHSDDPKVPFDATAVVGDYGTAWIRFVGGEYKPLHFRTIAAEAYSNSNESSVIHEGIPLTGLERWQWYSHEAAWLGALWLTFYGDE